MNFYEWLIKKLPKLSGYPDPAGAQVTADRPLRCIMNNFGDIALFDKLHGALTIYIYKSEDSLSCR